MTDELTHRTLAAAAFNATWELLERDRTPAEDLDLLELTLTSRHHWRAEGAAQQIAISDWMVARCFADLGQGALSRRFATSALAAAPPEAPAWLTASLHEGLARAHAACGDRPARDEEVARAMVALRDEEDAESRELIESQLATVPEPA